MRGNLFRRLTWPHGVQCLWWCPPWHRRGARQSYDDYLRSREQEQA